MFEIPNHVRAAAVTGLSKAVYDLYMATSLKACAVQCCNPDEKTSRQLALTRDPPLFKILGHPIYGPAAAVTGLFKAVHNLYIAMQSNARAIQCCNANDKASSQLAFTLDPPVAHPEVANTTSLLVPQTLHPESGKTAALFWLIIIFLIATCLLLVIDRTIRRNMMIAMLTSAMHFVDLKHYLQIPMVDNALDFLTDASFDFLIELRKTLGNISKKVPRGPFLVLAKIQNFVSALSGMAFFEQPLQKPEEMLPEVKHDDIKLWADGLHESIDGIARENE